MKGTIVQQYGPIYGEPVNGTVFGRPNGSVYVPPSNTVILSLAANTYAELASDGKTIAVRPDWKLSAQAQDLASNLQRQIFSDAECTQLIAVTAMAAGNFNLASQWFARLLDPDNPPTTGDKIYVRSQLFSSTGYAIATSEVSEVEYR